MNPEHNLKTPEYLKDILSNSHYTSCYCEENVYSFLQFLPLSLQSTSFALFISNSSQSNLLFHQKASSKKVEEHNWVIWDYHVVALVDSRGDLSVQNGKGRGTGKEKVVIVDQDSMLGDVTEIEEYLTETFKMKLFEEFEEVLPTPWRRQSSRFRLVPAIDFLSNFASDRSHMLLEQFISLNSDQNLPLLPSHYIRPPPLYPPIQGSGARARGELNNLFSRFIDMRSKSEREEEGDVVDEEGFGSVFVSINGLVSFLQL